MATPRLHRYYIEVPACTDAVWAQVEESAKCRPRQRGVRILARGTKEEGHRWVELQAPVAYTEALLDRVRFMQVFERLGLPTRDVRLLRRGETGDLMARQTQLAGVL